MALSDRWRGPAPAGGKLDGNTASLRLPVAVGQGPQPGPAAATRALDSHAAGATRKPAANLTRVTGGRRSGSLPVRLRRHRE
jgi:hypothetical protein